MGNARLRKLAGLAPRSADEAGSFAERQERAASARLNAEADRERQDETDAAMYAARLKHALSVPEVAGRIRKDAENDPALAAALKIQNGILPEGDPA